MKYSDQIADWLVEEGYTHCFFVAGGNNMHLVESLSRKLECKAFIHEVAAGIAAVKMTVPKAQTGISGFGGGNLMVGESGPEIMNVPRGTNVTGAETTRQMMGGNDNKDVVNEQKRTNEGIATLTSAITNLNITAGRGTLKVAMEPALGGRGL